MHRSRSHNFAAEERSHVQVGRRTEPGPFRCHRLGSRPILRDFHFPQLNEYEPESDDT